MKKICKEKLPLERFELPRAEARKLMEEKEEPYKVELIDDLPEDAVISFYKQGEFTDLCAGPHLDSTGRVKGNGIKLTYCHRRLLARRLQPSKMLQRIYGTAFPKKDELDALPATCWKKRSKRDHSKLGQGARSVHARRRAARASRSSCPRAMVLQNTLHRLLSDEVAEALRLRARSSTPIMLKPQPVGAHSGHWDHYKQNMYTTVIDDEDYAIKPMNCPGGMLVYKAQPHSYKDLPLRVGELGLVHRHELSGALHGLFRVRCFTQDDAPHLHDTGTR